MSMNYIVPAQSYLYTISLLDGKITRQMLKTRSGEFDVESIHTLILREQGRLRNFPFICLNFIWFLVAFRWLISIL